MRRFFCSEFAFWIFTTVLLAVALTVVVHGQDNGDTPPPEPGPNTPSCNNYHGSTHKCSCGKAVDCEGKIDDHPDPSKGKAWCSNYCKKDRCGCISPCETHMRSSHNGG